MQAVVAIVIWLLVFGMIGFLIWFIRDHRRYWREQGWDSKQKRFIR